VANTMFSNTENHSRYKAIAAGPVICSWRSSNPNAGRSEGLASFGGRGWWGGGAGRGGEEKKIKIE